RRGLAAVFIALLIGYWAAMTFAPLPEAGAFAKDANLARWIDEQFLPGLRLYVDWDPEGLLSTIPAVATCLLGVFAGLLLESERPPLRKAMWLACAGLIL